MPDMTEKSFIDELADKVDADGGSVLMKDSLEDGGVLFYTCPICARVHLITATEPVVLFHVFEAEQTQALIEGLQRSLRRN